MSKTYVPAQLRRQVAENAQNCCEYCLQPELFSFCVHEIDHIIAEKHGGQTLLIKMLREQRLGFCSSIRRIVCGSAKCG
jgi:hypothetical protein